MNPGIKKLGEDLKGLASLHTLNLRFFECSWITGGGLSGLNKGIESLVSLRNLSLWFSK